MLDHRHLGVGLSLALHLAVILALLRPMTAVPSKPRNAQRTVDRICDEQPRPASRRRNRSA